MSVDTGARQYVPRSSACGIENLPAPLEESGANGRATVLVVDDEPTVRNVIGAVLRKQGYRVLLASDGKEALGVCEREDGKVDAMVPDIVMPLMGANELLPLVTAQYPGTEVLLTSGYSEAEAKRLCAAHPGATFIQKPYTAQQIARAVEDLLAPVRKRQRARAASPSQPGLGHRYPARNVERNPEEPAYITSEPRVRCRFNVTPEPA